MKKISPISTPPSTSDSANFNERADTFLAALPNLANELNAFVDEFNGLGDAALRNFNKVLQKAKASLKSEELQALNKLNTAFNNAKKALVAMVALKNDEFEFTAQAVLN